MKINLGTIRAINHNRRIVYMYMNMRTDLMAFSSTAAFQKLIANKIKVGKGHVVIADGGTKLIYVKSGTRVIIR